MKYFEKWALGKPASVQAMAHIFCANLDFWQKIIDGIRFISLAQCDLPGFNPTEWLRFYRNHRTYEKIMGTIASSVKNIQLPGLSDFQSLDYENLSDNYWSQMIAASSLLSEPNSVEFDFEYDQSIVLPSLFYLKIVVPCQVIYKDDPGFLLRKARQGDFESIFQLVTLDKFVVYDKKISSIIQRHTLNNNDYFLSQLGKAISSEPPTIPLKKLKAHAASYIYYSANGMGFPLRCCDVQNLFDSIYKDKHGGEADPDFDMTPDGFEKLIKRHLKFWG